MASSLSAQQVNFNELVSFNSKGSHLEEIEDLSTCSVCFCEYNNDKRIAKFLPCFHTFCLECLRSLSSSTVIITCPLCRNTFTCNDGVDNLPSNMYALHLAKLSSHKAELKAKQMQRMLEFWCLTCESLANLSCHLSAPRHFLLTLRGSSQQEAEELQHLIKDLPLKKSLAIQKRKQFQSHLNLLLQSLKEVEDGVREQIIKNDLHLSGLLSLDEKIHTDILNENKEITVGIVKGSLSELVLKCEESLAGVAKTIDSLEAQKKIRIILNLKDSTNQIIPTFPLFEEGFYSNRSSQESLSTIDRNLLLISHLTFTVWNRWKISVNKAKLLSGASFSGVSFENPRVPLALLPSQTSTSVPSNPSSNTSMSTSPADSSYSEMPPNSHGAWGSAPVLSYSQVLNMAPKLPQPPKPALCLSSGNLPNFTLRFGQKGNGKFNVSSKFLGDVLIKMTSRANAAFSQELIRFCRKPREVTRRIIKASPGMFITVQVENPLMLDAMPAMQGLCVWESDERTKDAWDVGVNAVLDNDGQVVSWKMIFLLDKFKPNNMEVAMLFGKVLEGKDILQQLALRTKQDRFNVQVTLKTV